MLVQHQASAPLAVRPHTLQRSLPKLVEASKALRLLDPCRLAHMPTFSRQVHVQAQEL
jgi:hypothetical protein